MRRIVKIAVRFLHTKTALCDRKDTQSRFAVNAARSIVCVETRFVKQIYQSVAQFQCRTQHCVCQDLIMTKFKITIIRFQCRTQHCVCRDPSTLLLLVMIIHRFNAARSIVCVETGYDQAFGDRCTVSMPHAALCVSRPRNLGTESERIFSFQCRTQHCVCRDAIRDGTQSRIL